MKNKLILLLLLSSMFLVGCESISMYGVCSINWTYTKRYASNDVVCVKENDWMSCKLK